MLLAESLLGTSSVAATYIEDVFSTYLFTGNNSAQTITNGIDLSGKGGLVWFKARNAAFNHTLVDTARGNFSLASNTTSAQSSQTWTALSTGFTSPAFETYNYTSWTFRKQAKFFDIVTYTGNGVARTIAHNLGSVPGCIIVKKTSGTSNWAVYHRSLTSAAYTVLLNTNDAQMSDSAVWNSTAPTSTVFSVGGSTGGTNDSGETYVAYLFAHDAGGFGATGSDNVISCGSYTGTGAAGNAVTLGYEPQWLLMKRSSTSGNDWWLIDNMRGLTMGIDADLRANLSQAEENAANYVNPTATGFTVATTNAALNASGSTYIYIAIRRGPMKTPTSGTSVFDIQTYTGTQTARTITTANTVDLSYTKSRSTSGTRWNWTDRLRGATRTLDSSLSAAEASDTTGYTSFAIQTGYTLGTGDTYDVNTSGRTYASWNFRRAPGFFDEVCYTGTGSAQTVSHNLAAVPELMIVKCRSDNGAWTTYSSAVGNTKALFLNEVDAPNTNTYWNNTSPTSSVFSVGTLSGVNFSGRTYVAYLFATVAGVSKVGSYTGTGTTLQIDCGFTGGARFVLIKRTDSTGDWYVWDTARGIVAGDDPYILINSTAAEVTNTDYVDSYSAGFELSSTAPAAINASGGSFIFLAVA